MVKIFIGNIPPAATSDELRTLFEQYGSVSECDIVSNYAFVHMDDRKAANVAVSNLNGYELHGVSINVEHSKGKPRASTKLHVRGLSSECTSDDLREKFEEYGSVLECDIVRDYAFVHMERAEEALDAIRNLNNREFKGRKMYVQLSTSRLRVTPGMGDRSRCYRCGKDGHWSGDCPSDQGARAHPPPPPPSHYDPYLDAGVPMRSVVAAYAERMLLDERRNLIDYYQRYRARPSAYDTVLDHGLPPLPQSSVSTITHRKRLESYPYERHVLPPPPPSYTRDRSPIRHSTTSIALEEYGMDRRMSSAIRSSLYETTRYEIREPYPDRLRYY